MGRIRVIVSTASQRTSEEYCRNVTRFFWEQVSMDDDVKGVEVFVGPHRGVRSRTTPLTVERWEE